MAMLAASTAQRTQDLLLAVEAICEIDQLFSAHETTLLSQY